MRVGIVGDVHAPFVHPLYLRFCQDVFAAWRVNQVVLIGDIVDQHALSFWDHDPNGMSAADEARNAEPHVQAWYRAFPRAPVCIGNHDERHFRLARKHGLPDRYLKSYAAVWQTPAWRWDYAHEIDGVIYTHGTNCSGKNAALNLAIGNRQSTAIGHLHYSGGVTWDANRRSRIFGINVGCGLDCKAYAFAYGRDFVRRPTLGCGIVIDGQFAYFEPMAIGRGERYHRSRAGRGRTRKVA